jgi:chromosome partitioning protein
MAQIITIAHQKGGVGKSTLSLNLAFIFKQGLSIGICDADLQGSISSILADEDDIELLPLPVQWSDFKGYKHEIIIIDTPPYLSSQLPSLFEISDFVLIPTKAGVFDLLAIKSTIALVMQTMQTNKQLQTGIVFNMVKKNTLLKNELESMLSNSTIQILDTIITDRVSYSRTLITKGVLQSKDTKAKEEIISLADEILNKLGI